MKTNHHAGHFNKAIMLGNTSECLERAQHDGYTTDFVVKHGKLVAPEGCKEYSSGDVVVNSYYIPGEDDYLSTQAMYLVEAADGTKGILIDNHGAFFDNEINKFIKKTGGVYLKK